MIDQYRCRVVAKLFQTSQKNTVKRGGNFSKNILTNATQSGKDVCRACWCYGIRQYKCNGLFFKLEICIQNCKPNGTINRVAAASTFWPCFLQTGGEMSSCPVHAERRVMKWVALCTKQQRHVLVCHNMQLQEKGIQENLRLIRRYVGWE
jgi:hypothetical protein